jgi:hypothetical protein
VRACLRSHEIVAEPFLIGGILAGIKEIVVLAVEAATLLKSGPEFSRAIVEIGVLGGVVLVLARAASCCESGAARAPAADISRRPDDVHRTVAKNVRRSSTKSSGCSKAAKCPPRGIVVQ